MKYIKEYKDIDWDDWDDVEDDPNIHNDFIGHEDFYNFLVEHDVLNDFIYSYDPHYSTNNGMNLKEYLNNHKERHYFIDSAFDWSLHRHVRWSKLSILWSRYMVDNDPVDNDLFIF